MEKKPRKKLTPLNEETMIPPRSKKELISQAYICSGNNGESWSVTPGFYTENYNFMIKQEEKAVALDKSRLRCDLKNVESHWYAYIVSY
jgi:hypothetical protein